MLNTEMTDLYNMIFKRKSIRKFDKITIMISKTLLDIFPITTRHVVLAKWLDKVSFICFCY